MTYCSFLIFYQRKEEGRRRKEGSDIVGKFLLRVEDDIEYRREKMPARYRAKVDYHGKGEEEKDAHNAGSW